MVGDGDFGGDGALAADCEFVTHGCDRYVFGGDKYAVRGDLAGGDLRCWRWFC